VPHFLNHAERQVATNYPVNDFIPTLTPQRVTQTSVPHRKMLWRPGGFALGSDWREGILNFDTSPLSVHHMAVLG